MKKVNGTAFTDNGTGRFSMSAIQKELAYHRSAVEAIEFTLSLMNGHVTAVKQQRGRSTGGPEQVIAQALQEEAERTPAKTPKWDKATALARRKRTAKTLKKLSKTVPFPGSKLGRGVAVLALHGFIEKKGDGYVRTDKPFTV